MKIKKALTLEQLFKNATARTLADQAIDKLPMSATMAEYIDCWENAYFDAARASPMRPGK